MSPSCSPLVVIGNGAVSVSGERSVPKLIESWNIPFISKSMARGVVPDNHPLGANSARSKALAGADVVLVLGASLDWQLHFGEPPKWASNPKFILVGNTIAERDADVAAATLHGDVGTIAEQLLAQVPGRLACEPWCEALAAKANAAEAKMEQTLQQEKFPLNYETTLRVLRDEIRAASPAPVVVSEGANTMDQAR